MKKNFLRLQPKTYNLKPRSGFTLVEVLIVVAILVIVSSVTFLGLSRYKGGEDLELTMSEAVAVIREAQRRSITEQDGKQWGIRFSNASSSYEIFSGATYSTSTVERTYPLSRNVIFGNPATSTVDAIFSAISGKLGENRIISLTNKRRDGLVGDITLTLRGTITSRLEHGVVGYWHFDEATSTTAYDSSGFANAGALTSGPTWQSASNCRAGACLSFDGTNDFVDMSDKPEFDPERDNWTVSAWIKISVTPDGIGDDIVGYANSGGSGDIWRLFVKTDGKAEFRYSSDDQITVRSASSTSQVNNGQWRYVVGVRDGTTVRIYVDGVQESTGTGDTNEIKNGTATVDMGKNPGSALTFFTGSIDEVRIYNRALTAAEILNLYNDLK